MPSLTRLQLEDWLKTIEIKGGKILDVGGSQYPLKRGRLKVFEPDEYKILDLEKPHYCKKEPDILMDLNYCWCENKPKIDLQYNNYFDIAFCLEVMEYIWNPYWALRNINCFLKKGGIFYSSWQFLYPIHSPKEWDYLRYTPRGVEKLLKQAGFEILEMKPKLMNNDSLLYWKEFISCEKMRPAKDCDKQNWAGCMVKARKL